jgi:hypothetical protein
LLILLRLLLLLLLLLLPLRQRTPTIQIIVQKLRERFSAAVPIVLEVPDRRTYSKMMEHGIIMRSRGTCRSVEPRTWKLSGITNTFVGIVKTGNGSATMHAAGTGTVQALAVSMPWHAALDVLFR